MFIMAINTDNFGEEDRDWELRRILVETANRIYNGHEDGVVFDINGNRCGDWTVNGEPA